MRFLVDSSASTMQEYFVLHFFSTLQNEVNATQFSSIVGLRFFRRFRHIFPNLWPQSVWSGGGLFSYQSPSTQSIPHPVLPLRVSSNLELRVSSYTLRFVCFDGRRMFSPRDQKDPDVHDANSACVWNTLLYNSSPVFMKTTFSKQIAGTVLKRVIALDRVW